MLRLFIRSTRGNVALLFALLLPMILGAVGLAVDVANLLNVKTQLQNAADVGVLVASREGASESQRRNLFDNYLKANFSENGVTIVGSSVDIEAGINHLRVNGHATANVESFFMRHLGMNQVSVVASTFRSTKSMEIAVVLDNTGSMGTSGINALKKASHALVDAIEAGRAPNQDVRVSLVPFVTAVNIKGEGFNMDWIDTTGQSLYNGWNFLDGNLRQERQSGVRRTRLPEGFGSNDTGNGYGGGQACNNQGKGAPAIEKRERCLADNYPHHLYLFQQSNTEWKGCVEARPYPYNFSLDAPDPSKPDTLFVPYFAPDEPDGSPAIMTQGGNSPTAFNNSWLEDRVTGTKAERLRSTLKYINPAAKSVNNAGPLTIGPNRACPTPIVPLTTEFSKVRAGIDSMIHWNGSGTNIAEGLAWGWRVLSPQAPYTQAGAFNPVERQKYLVLMTDGSNVSFGARNETITRSDYGSYNFLANGFIGGTVNQGTAEATLNGWTQDMCTEMKSQGIEIFTVIYNTTASAVQNLFRNCASRSENFYMTNNTASLENAFANIGRQMSRLRLTQ
jgi:Flp pilus assembly protein TadG